MGGITLQEAIELGLEQGYKNWKKCKYINLNK
jgi:hypothetical protein